MVNLASNPTNRSSHQAVGGNSRRLRRWTALFRALILAAALVAGAAGASPSTWKFAPQSAGRALYEGGWMQAFTIGEVSASPEFTFPIQLIYLSQRAQNGLLGPQWFCPQLESSVIPKGAGVFVWQMPSGGMVPFYEDRKQRCHVDPNGQWRADVVGSRVVISNQEGWKYSYRSGRINAVVSPTERVLNFKYSGSQLAAVELRDPLGSGAAMEVLRVGFDKADRLRAVEVHGQVHEFAYLPAETKALHAWRQPNGEVVQFAYQAPGILAGIQAGSRTPVVLRTEFVDPTEAGGAAEPGKVPKRDVANYWIVEDDVYAYEYGGDEQKKQWNPSEITLTTPGGLKREMTFSGQRGLLTTSASSAEQETVFYYRAPGQSYNGKLRRIERGGRLVVEYRYNRKTGLLSEIHDANGRITLLDYPDVATGRTKDGWDIKPVRVRKGDRKSSEVVAEYRYDAAWRVTAVRDAAGEIKEFGYSARGDLITLIDSGQKTTFTHDPLGRITSVERGDQKESVEFDERGRLAARTGLDGARVEFQRDKLGNVVRVLRDGQLLVENLYDASGRPVGEKDALGRVRKVERDTRGNVTAEYAPNGSVTKYEYDARGLRTAQIDGNGNRIEFAYDPSGRLIRQTNPLGGTLTWKYDDTGKLIERTNGEQTIRHAYNKDSQLESLDYGAGQIIRYEHDAEGRIARAATPSTSFEYAHDKFGRTDALRAIRGSSEQMVRFRYDPAGRRTGLLLAELTPGVAARGGRAGESAGYNVLAQIDYTYSATGQLASIVCNGQPVAQYQYDAIGRPAERTYGNGIKAAISYDPMGRLAGVEFIGGPLSEVPVTLAYEWDPANQVTRRAWNGEIQRYEYDPSGQLLKVLNDADGSSLEEYTYDQAGNMLRKSVVGSVTTMTYNAANQLTSLTSGLAGVPSADRSSVSNANSGTTVAYHYDKAGRMLGPEGGARSAYGWLDKVVELTTADARKIAYEYWPDGQLAAKQEAGAGRSAGIQRISNSATSGQSPTELDTFLWDGLALLRRGDTIYINEPHPSGGAVIASFPVGKPERMTHYLNDMLGTTLATVEGGTIRYARLSAFGQQLDQPTLPQPTTIAPPSSGADFSQNNPTQQPNPTTIPWK